MLTLFLLWTAIPLIWCDSLIITDFSSLSNNSLGFPQASLSFSTYRILSPSGVLMVPSSGSAYWYSQFHSNTKLACYSIPATMSYLRITGANTTSLTAQLRRFNVCPPSTLSLTVSSASSSNWTSDCNGNKLLDIPLSAFNPNSLTMLSRVSIMFPTTGARYVLYKVSFESSAFNPAVCSSSLSTTASSTESSSM